MTTLEIKHCQVCEGGVSPLSEAEIKERISHMPEGWQYDSLKKRLTKVFQFSGFLKTMGFVNAVAWIANREGHHPDLEVSYNSCTVHYQTHASNGVTENDFICAEKIEQLFL